MNEDQLRIGDAERERAAAELGDHYAQGRLTAEEHAERLDRIWAARTRADLAPLFRDLPGQYSGYRGRYAGPEATSVGGRPGGPPWRSPWGSQRMAQRRAPWGLPVPVVVVLALLLAVTVLTHVPFILIGLIVFLCWSARRHHHGYR